MEDENDVEIKNELQDEEKKELGLYTIKHAYEEDVTEGKTKFYYGSLRSGQRVEYEGSLVIVGDVNSGAEVIAGGNIVIVGILRGVAHAGANGNKKAQISAMGINPPQIRIANIIKEIHECREIKRETAKVVGNEIAFCD